MVFVYFGFSLAVHLIVLPLLAPIMWKFKASFNYNSELYWLVSLPVLILIHAVLPGILCKLPSIWLQIETKFTSNVCHLN